MPLLKHLRLLALGLALGWGLACGGGGGSTGGVSNPPPEPPVATSLVASSSTITLGTPVNLTPTFSGGTGKIGTSAGASDVTASATSGTAVTVTPGSTTTYYL
ncbi:MAG: hypothetical protein ACKN9J_03825, partial [Holophagaceae bacterium]